MFNDNIERMLNRTVFNEITIRFGTPDLDLFASRLNPDPGAESVDAFSLNWGGMYIYAFPPFCLINRCLTKIKQDKATGILVVPDWPTQAWFPKILGIIVQPVMVVPKRRDLLVNPVSGSNHPLSDRINLLVCRF